MMSVASERAIHALEQVVKVVPVGTNLALLHLLWAMLSGAFQFGGELLLCSGLGDLSHPPE